MSAGRESLLRGRYLVRNRAANLGLRVLDALLRALVPRRPAPGAPARRVLVAVGGHLGDAVIATTVLAPLRRALPEARIGILAPSWCAPVFEGHPAVHALHTLDHWKLDRSGRSFVARWLAHRRSAAAAVRAVRRERYDLAIDLYPYFPNAAAVLWRAGIPKRVGFESGGLGPLYTTALPWTDGGRHAADRHLELLRAAGVDVGDAAPAYGLPPVPEAARARAAALLAAHGVEPGSYVVVHMGAGHPAKEWPPERWRELARSLGDDGHRVVFTGAGAHEGRRIERLLPHVPGAVDLCDRVSLAELTAVLGDARLVATVDTVAGHLAAALGRPTVVLMAPIGNATHWRPLGAKVTILEADWRPMDSTDGVMSELDGGRMATVDAARRAVYARLEEATSGR